MLRGVRGNEMIPKFGQQNEKPEERKEEQKWLLISDLDAHNRFMNNRGNEKLLNGKNLIEK